MSTFLIGEVDFDNRFYGEPTSTPASFIVTMTFYGAAILLLHIALLNLLIGLTSIDIKVRSFSFSILYPTSENIFAF
jgi:hypothetical protein